MRKVYLLSFYMRETSEKKYANQLYWNVKENKIFIAGNFPHHVEKDVENVL